MLELLQQVLGFGVLGLVVVSYICVLLQKPEMDKVYDMYLNRKR
jgi:hypothetical protein